MTNPPLWVWELGTLAYADAWALQDLLLNHRATGKIAHDMVLMVEHPHTFTVGRRGGRDHIVEPTDPDGQPIPVFEVDRGGDITYHGPGQLVVYPILRLELFGNDVLRYLRSLENMVVSALSRLNVASATNPPFTGVWTNGRKIASIGVGVQRGVTKHGVALNYAVDLSFFRRIVPCGLQWAQMTRIEDETGQPTTRASVVNALCGAVSQELSRSIVPMPMEWQDQMRAGLIHT